MVGEISSTFEIGWPTRRHFFGSQKRNTNSSRGFATTTLGKTTRNLSTGGKL